MGRYFLFPLVFLCLFSPFSCKEKKNLSTSDSLNLLKAEIEKRELYKQRLQPECLGFVFVMEKEYFVEIAVVEKHNDQCKGDPNTQPVVDRFRVTNSGEITIYDLVDDRYIEFDP